MQTAIILLQKNYILQQQRNLLPSRMYNSSMNYSTNKAH